MRKIGPVDGRILTAGEWGIRSLLVLVDLATRTNLRNDDREVEHAKKDSKIADSCRSLVVSALQMFRVLRVERISLQLFELLP